MINGGVVGGDLPPDERGTSSRDVELVRVLVAHGLTRLAAAVAERLGTTADEAGGLPAPSSSPDFVLHNGGSSQDGAATDSGDRGRRTAPSRHSLRERQRAS